MYQNFKDAANLQPNFKIFTVLPIKTNIMLLNSFKKSRHGNTFSLTHSTINVKNVVMTDQS